MLEVALGLSWEAIMQLTVGKEAEEKVKRVAEDLRREYLPIYLYLRSVGCMLSTWLFFRVSALGAHTVQGLWRLGESTG